MNVFPRHQVWSALAESFSRFRRLRFRHVLPDLILAGVCHYLALAIHTGHYSLRPLLPVLNLSLPLVISLRFLTFGWMGVYDIIWRYISMRDAVLIIRSVIFSSISIAGAVFLVRFEQMPRMSLLLSSALLAFGMLGMRFFRRYLHEYPAMARLQREGIPTLIYGAGRNGRTLAQRISTDPGLGYQLLGFIDDDPEKLGRLLTGFTVLGHSGQLSEILHTTKARELIVAVATPPGDLLLKIMQACAPLGIKPRLIKQGADSFSAGAQVDVVRDIDLGDLLERKKRDIDLGSLRNFLQGKRVLVTGAGGSIGSEIAKQIFALEPQKLLLLDHSEYALYEIDQTLRGTDKHSPVIPLLADIKDRKTLEAAFEIHQPQVIFHAAAYKHVHLVEANPHSAITNNILGTRHLLELAEEFHTEAFILISSDKAVNPGGIMGATKRVCELMVTEAGIRTGKRFASVRFGNVLGSSGSLIPLLQEQILNGKPITITHPDMKRYFMLIPEAVSLVLRAATLASAGDIMVLSMGEPVKIVDLAKSLMVLMGKKVNEVPILFTGIRPGEKLQEELYLTGAEHSTSDPDIMLIPMGDSFDKMMNSQFPLDEEVGELLWESHHSQALALRRIYQLIRGQQTLEKSAVPGTRPASHPKRQMPRPPTSEHTPYPN